ncbi:MAG: lytic murein transglycosylase [Solirubrobacterales bacterium]
MRNKLALTIALASFALATALGVGLAGADLPSNVETVAPLPSTPALPSLSGNPTPLPACSDGVDNDGDGLIDLEDPDCTSPSDTNEAPEPPTSPEPEAAPKEEPAAEAGGGFKAGTSIGGGGGSGKSKKVVHNQTLGETSGGGGSSGGITAPPATAGIQPQSTRGVSGGSAFNSGGSPTSENPTVTIAPFGPAPIGVPNFVINSFEIPPFLLPIYQACGTEYGIPWEVLASINKIETDFGTNLNVSSAGAEGWMQFLPSSWETYGLDANGDGRKDPYNPVDAICAAAHYLKVAGGTKNLYNAILSYNHADWYVQEVLLYARAYGKLPTDLIGSLTGLTEGAHFPIAADARYADELSARAALAKATPREKRRSYGNAAEIISSSPTRRGINIFAAAGSPVVAVNDGVIEKVGYSKTLGRYIVLEDAYGNRFTYAELGKVVQQHHDVVLPSGKEKQVPVDSENIRPRLFALPGRAQAHPGHQPQQEAREGVDEAARAGADGTLKVGSRVIAGTVLARVGKGTGGISPHINFSIRPAGRGAPRIDPKPILDGWKLLEATAIYRAEDKSAFASGLGSAGVLLLPKEALQKRVLADESLSIYKCGRRDIATGQIDRRVLAMLEYLVSKGFKLTISSLKCGNSDMTSSGYASEHTTGDAVDIAAIDGVPVAGHQGPGTLTDELIKDVLALQGTMHPHQVISLENLPGPTSFAMPDHADHVHIGYHPAFESAYVSPFLNASEGRIDMGVDFTGSGPIAAVGNARILRTGAPGWPEGGGVLYQLLDGPRAGEIIYVYEGVDATVRAGEKVGAGQQIANFRPGGSIEMGFADAAGAPLSAPIYHEGDETAWGARMADFMAGIGSPSTVAAGFGELSASQWDLLTARLEEIPSPKVPVRPSQSSLPDKGGQTPHATPGQEAKRHGGGGSGGTESGG